MGGSRGRGRGEGGHSIHSREKLCGNVVRGSLLTFFLNWVQPMRKPRESFPTSSMLFLKTLVVIFHAHNGIFRAAMRPTPGNPYNSTVESRDTETQKDGEKMCNCQRRSYTLWKPSRRVVFAAREGERFSFLCLSVLEMQSLRLLVENFHNKQETSQTVALVESLDLAGLRDPSHLRWGREGYGSARRSILHYTISRAPMSVTEFLTINDFPGRPALFRRISPLNTFVHVDLLSSWVLVGR